MFARHGWAGPQMFGKERGVVVTQHANVLPATQTSHRTRTILLWILPQAKIHVKQHVSKSTYIIQTKGHTAGNSWLEGKEVRKVSHNTKMSPCKSEKGLDQPLLTVNHELGRSCGNSPAWRTKELLLLGCPCVCHSTPSFSLPLNVSITAVYTRHAPHSQYRAS